MRIATFLGLIMIVCGIVLMWSTTGALAETRQLVTVLAGLGQIGVGIAWILFRHRFDGPKQ